MARLDQIGDGPVQPEYEAKMRELARGIDHFFNGESQIARTGFILMGFDFAGPKDRHRCNYMSNAQRDEVVQLLEEQIRHFNEQKRKEKH